MRFAIIEFPGSNCDHDCYHVIRHILGHDADFVWHGETSLAGFDIVIIPGGFSYGDYLRAGAIARLSPVMTAVKRHVDDGGAVLGICNGFQILTEAGLLPGALMRNESMKFVCKDTWLRVETTDSFVTNSMRDGEIIKIPVAHMEGRYIADDDTLDLLDSEDLVLFRYCDTKRDTTQQANPNGSMRGIAGILSANRNVAGMMPHPERACEESLGGTDGMKIFSSIVSKLVSA